MVKENVRIVTMATPLPLIPTLSLALWLGVVTLPYTYPKGKGVPRDSYLPVSTRAPSECLGCSGRGKGGQWLWF